MRKVMIIPTYWGRPQKEAWRPGDAVYDHPTPLDGKDTLGRTLESLKILDDKKFKLVLLVCPTAPELEQAATARVREIVEAVNLPVETYLFTPADLARVAALYAEKGGRKDALSVFTMAGYPNVRNICLLTAAILTADAALLVDDDEVIEHPDFLSRATEFLGKRVYGDTVHGVAGYYLNRNGQYYDDVAQRPWMTYWDRFNRKAEAFDRYIGAGPRLKRTPFAFGGAMVISRELFSCVPFDTCITRGEDVDYVINARMYGFSFFLDNTLSVKHLPEPKTHPAWQSIREDIYRFVYEKAKLEAQYPVGNMVAVTAEEFSPYPGAFLKADLEDKIYRANMMLSQEALAGGKVEDSLEALENISIAGHEAKPAFNAFTRYRDLQKQWEAIMQFVAENRYAARCVLEDHNLSRAEIVRDEGHNRLTTPEELALAIRRVKAFAALSDEEVAILSANAGIKTYYEGETLFRKGDANDTFCVVIKGALRLYAGGGAEEEIDIARLGPGDVLGESCLIFNTFAMSGEAAEFTELIAIEAPRLRAIIENEAALGVKILRYFLSVNATKLLSTNTLLRKALENGPPVASLFIEEQAK